tara:strand:- start:1248 stop:1403 length:156 start_codon:yes stop_codon:yes gene_type:complete
MKLSTLSFLEKNKELAKSYRKKYGYKKQYNSIDRYDISIDWLNKIDISFFN